MTLHKICNKINKNNQSWQKYCLWRNYNFTEFESLDSHLHNSIYKVSSDQDWEYAVTNGMYLTDIISNYEYAVKRALELKADEILNFDYIENEINEQNRIGYEILDCNFSYSLLTNFGNDIKIVNNCLAKNALIRHKNQAIDVHNWFLKEMAQDAHVQGSKIFVVYEKSAQQADSSDLATNAIFATVPARKK